MLRSRQACLLRSRKDRLIELVAKEARLVHLWRVEAAQPTPRSPNAQEEDFQLLVAKGKDKGGLGLPRW